VSDLRSVRPFACAVLLAAAAACRSHSSAPPVAPAVGVTVQTVRSDTMRDVASGTGVIAPTSSGDLTVAAPEPGRIVELPLKEGDSVAVGDLLVRFDLPSISQLLSTRQADVSQATARLDRAKTDAARQSDLFGRGFLSRNAYQAGQDAVASAESQLAEATSNLQTAQSAASADTVRAHFAGVVNKVWHAPGDSVGAGLADPVLRIVDPTHVQATMDLPVKTLLRIVPGQAATVLGDDRVSHAATVATTALPASPDATTGQVRLAFAAPPGLAIDAPVNIVIVLDERPGALIVPISAILRDDGGSYVMVAGDDDRAHRRDIGVGIVTGDSAQVTGGLRAGERVIVGGATSVADGTRISIAAG
jgi:membrane fusion protein (multidrug efflux system)